MNAQWNLELLYRLIDQYRERPVLWDTSSEWYKDREKRHAAWEEIAEAMGMDRETVERKMKILVFQFRRELMKPKMGMNGVSKWFGFERMLFLKDRWVMTEIRPKQRSKVTKFDKVNTYSYVPQPTPKPPKPEKHTNSEEIIQKTPPKRESKPLRDEFQIYGEYVAAKLSKLNRHASNTAQYHINNILFNADMGKYDQYESTDPIIDHSSRGHFMKIDIDEANETYEEFNNSGCSN